MTRYIHSHSQIIKPRTLTLESMVANIEIKDFIKDFMFNTYAIDYTKKSIEFRKQHIDSIDRLYMTFAHDATFSHVVQQLHNPELYEIIVTQCWENIH